MKFNLEKMALEQFDCSHEEIRKFDFLKERLSSNVPKTRSLAVAMLARSDADMGEKTYLLQQIAIEDADTKVARSAISALGRMYLSSRNKEVSRWLALIVLNKQLSDRQRVGAYHSLERVNETREIPTSIVGKVRQMEKRLLDSTRRGIGSLNQINWDYVEQFVGN